RPRWRTPMVAHQQLRWFRTTLLGRTPGWSPAAPPVGLWRDVWVETRRTIEVHDVRVHPVVRDRHGVLHLSARISPLNGQAIERVEASAIGETRESREVLDLDIVTGRYSGVVSLEAVDLWWPHTHGTPAGYSVRLDVHLAGSREPVSVDLG